MKEPTAKSKKKTYRVRDIELNFVPSKTGYGELKHNCLVIAAFSNGTLTPPITKEETLELLKSTFEELGLTPTNLTFREDAGCTICNCTPGYCIDIDGIIGGLNRIKIFLSLERD